MLVEGVECIGDICKRAVRLRRDFLGVRITATGGWWLPSWWWWWPGGGGS